MNSKDVQISPFVFGHSQSSEKAVSVFFYSYEVVKPLPVNTGKVGPQVDVPTDKYLRGGGDQFEMLVAPRKRMDYIKLVNSRSL